FSAVCSVRLILAIYQLYKYYVAVTRAKSKLFIILTDTWTSKQNLKKLRCIFTDRNIELEDLVTID
uniref:hypothetical protein n=1 Tax=Leuconostoc mesenteroides TaxID=1245 RepID=UPI0023615467